MGDVTVSFYQLMFLLILGPGSRLLVVGGAGLCKVYYGRYIRVVVILAVPSVTLG